MIDRLVCPADKAQAFLRDAEIRTLRVRVTRTGAKSFVFEKKLDKQTIRRTIGSVQDWTIADARKEAARLSVTIDQKIDPREVDRDRIAARDLAKAERERAAKYTLGALMADYANELERRGKSSHTKVRGIVRLHITEGAPALAATPAAQVTGEQVADLLRALTEAGKIRTAGKLRSYARAAFEMARTAKLDRVVPVHFKGYEVRHNPVAETAGIEQADDKKPLMPPHLRQYWKAIEPLQGVKGAVLRLHLLTGGQRIEQLRKLDRANSGKSSITLIDRKGRAGDKARKHIIPLIAQARAALDVLLSINTGEHPISADGGLTPLSARTLADWAKQAAAGVQWLECDYRVGDFQAKRLRSGVETCLASLRVSQDIRGRLLSHGVAGVQASSYDGHEYQAEKLEALETLHRFLTEDSANVVHINPLRAVG
jgi:hypothetical protein